MLTVAGLEVSYGEHRALAGVDLDVADGEIVAVLGPSGSGKSTLLRVIAGLEIPDAGTVAWDGEDLAGVPVHRRNFGLMFQDFALFPHRSVSGNVAFGLRMQGLPAAEVTAGVTAALKLVGLDDYGDRSVGTLSGGEAQRVALARALAPRPRLIMLDEPLGSLDRELRDRLMFELRELLAAAGITAIYVTHDQAEAFALADRLAVLHGGRILQEGRPDEVWAHPASEVVARFLGLSNIADATVAEPEGSVAATPWGRMSLGRSLPGGSYRIAVRPERLRPCDGGPIRGTVVSHTFRGDHVVLRIEAGGPPLHMATSHPVADGTDVELDVDQGGVIVLGPATSA